MHNVLVSLAALGVLPEFLEIHHYSPKPQITVSPPPRWINANGEQLEWEQLEVRESYYPSYPGVKISPDRWNFGTQNVPALSKVPATIFVNTYGSAYNVEYRWANSQ